jgi:hypothetical protein
MPPNLAGYLQQLSSQLDELNRSLESIASQNREPQPPYLRPILRTITGTSTTIPGGITYSSDVDIVGLVVFPSNTSRFIIAINDDTSRGAWLTAATPNWVVPDVDHRITLTKGSLLKVIPDPAVAQAYDAWIWTLPQLDVGAIS